MLKVHSNPICEVTAGVVPVISQRQTTCCDITDWGVATTTTCLTVSAHRGSFKQCVGVVCIMPECCTVSLHFRMWLRKKGDMFSLRQSNHCGSTTYQMEPDLGWKAKATQVSVELTASLQALTGRGVASQERSEGCADIVSIHSPGLCLKLRHTLCLALILNILFSKT